MATMTCDFLFSMLEGGFLPLFQKITRPNLIDNRIKSGSCIDNIFIKTESQLTVESYKISCPLTDHFPLFSAVDFTVEQSGGTGALPKINYNKLTKLCSEFDWMNFLHQPDPNVSMSEVVKKIDSFVKQATFTVKKKQN